MVVRVYEPAVFRMGAVYFPLRALSTFRDTHGYAGRMGSQPPSFGSWLLLQIHRAGWEPADFARAAEVSSGLTSNWINGNRKPKGDSIIKIAAALGLSPAYVFEVAEGIATDADIAEYERLRDIAVAQQQLRNSLVLLEAAEKGRARVRKVVVVGCIPADTVRWFAAADSAEPPIEIAESTLAGARNVRAARIVGDCMHGINIGDGDYIIFAVEPLRQPKDHDLVVVRVNEDVTFKRWRVVDGAVELHDGDGRPVYRISEADELEIIGYYLTIYRPVALARH